MVQINFAHKQINAKVVYYGPGMSGKTTNLEIVHQRAPSDNRGDLTSISTDGDRTLFFDYMPLDLGSIAGMKTSFQMYTVPGQVYYNSTRKLVLQGVDGVIFIADSSPDSMEANIEALRNLEENLNEYGKSLATLPHVIQFNKRDLPEAVSLEEMNKALNPHEAPFFEAVAATGQGVFPTLKGLAALVLRNIQAECASGSSLARTGFHRSQGAAGAAPAAAPAGAAQPAAPRAPLSMSEPEPATAGAAVGQSDLSLSNRPAEPAAPIGAAPAPIRPVPVAPQGAEASAPSPAPPVQPVAAPRSPAPAVQPAPASRSTAPAARPGVKPAGRTPGTPAMGSTQIMRRTQATGAGAGSSRSSAASRGSGASVRSHSAAASTEATQGSQGGTKTFVVMGAAAVVGAIAAFLLLKFL